MTQLKLNFHAIKAVFTRENNIDYKTPTSVLLPQDTVMQILAFRPIASDRKKKIMEDLLERHSEAWKALADK